jgi:hypothetical protein
LQRAKDLGKTPINEYRTCDLRDSRAVARKPRSAKIVPARQKAFTSKAACMAGFLID